MSARSPRYPGYNLETAIQNIDKIHSADRMNPIDREVAVKHLGYSGISGSSDKASAALLHYGLLEKVAKREVRVSQLAVDILYPEGGEFDLQAIKTAAFMPRVFQDLKARFPDDHFSLESLKSYLVREGYIDSAVAQVAKIYQENLSYLNQYRIAENGDTDSEAQEKTASSTNVADKREMNVSVGDYVQWASLGVLQFEEPRQVRWVSEDGEWLAVEDSDTSIRMAEVSVENMPVKKTPPPQPPKSGIEQSLPETNSFAEWFRVKVATDKLITINYRGEGEIGPREIDKLMKILEAQKLALED